MGSRSVFSAKCFLGGLGYQGPKNTLVQKTISFLVLPPSAARPKKTIHFRNMNGICGPGTPGLQNNHSAKNHFGTPSVIALPKDFPSPLPPGMSWRGSRLPFSEGNLLFLADFGPDPGGNLVVVLILTASTIEDAEAAVA